MEKYTWNSDDIPYYDVDDDRTIDYNQQSNIIKQIIPFLCVGVRVSYNQ